MPYSHAISPQLKRIDLHQVIITNGTKQRFESTDKKSVDQDMKMNKWEIVEHHLTTFIHQAQTVTRSRHRLYKMRIHRTRRTVKFCFDLLLQGKRFDQLNETSKDVDAYEPIGGDSPEQEWIFFNNYKGVCDSIVSPY